MTWTPPKPAIVNTEECELYYTLEQLLAVRNEALEEAAKKCDDIENDYWRLYQGQKPYLGNEAGRADSYVAGQSDGAGECGEAILKLKEQK